MAKEKHRCAWAGTDDPLMIAYHDEEWGRPVRDDRVWFEFLVLEGAQAGLSWRTILHKRENYRRALSNFNPKKIADYGASDVKRLLVNEGIVRNKLKIMSTIQNARSFLDVQNEFGSFDTYIWDFVGGKPIKNTVRSPKDVPAR